MYEIVYTKERTWHLVNIWLKLFKIKCIENPVKTTGNYISRKNHLNKKKNNIAACGWRNDTRSRYTFLRLCIEMIDTFYITLVIFWPLNICFPYDWSVRYDFIDWRLVLLEKGQGASLHDFLNSFIPLLTSALVQCS